MAATVLVDLWSGLALGAGGVLVAVSLSLRGGHRAHEHRASAEVPGGKAFTERSLTYLIDGGEVTLVSGRVEAGPAGIGPVPATLADLARGLAVLDGELEALLLTLNRTGEGFGRHARDRQGVLWRVEGQPLGLKVRLTMTEAGRAELDLLDRVAALEAETGAGVEDSARALVHPVPTFETGPDGAITWHNRAAGQLLDIGLGSRSLRAMPPVEGEGRMLLENRDGRAIGWAQVDRVALSGERTLICVQDANATRRAEKALRSFIATLTETFAHLDVALVIFDREWLLTLFNPAATDLFGINPAELAAKPGLREFLDRLRARQMVPEQVDFRRWRGEVIDSFRAVESQCYLEDWPLPNGQILRVNALPHPGGALALTFEDISRYVALEQKYLSEIELGHAILDRLPDGIAIVGLSGELVFANLAFLRAWGIEDAGEGLRGVPLARLEAALAPRLGDPEQVAALRAFVLGEARNGVLDLRLSSPDLPAEKLRLAALPDGSSLLTMPGEALAGVRSPHEEPGLDALDGRSSAAGGH